MLRRTLAAIFLALAISGLPPTNTHAQQGDWLVIASRNDLHEAIGIARQFPAAEARVFRSQGGLFTVALGPYEDDAAERRRSELLSERLITQDARLLRSEAFTDEVWRRRDPVEVDGPFDGRSTPLRVSAGDLEVTLSRERSRRAQHNVVLAVGRLRGTEVFREIIGDEEFEGTDPEEPRAHVSIVRLDRRTRHPQVTLSHFTGGAHCCTAMSILTEGPDGRWVRVEVDERDGEGFSFEDLDGDGAAEILAVDNRFLYAFAPYALSSAPPTIHVLEGTSLREAVTEPRFAAYLRQVYSGMEFTARANPELMGNNGFLGGFVGVAARIGRFEEAYRRAVENHDRDSNWNYERCRVPVASGDTCPVDQKQQLSFPDFLTHFLRENGYLPH